MVFEGLNVANICNDLYTTVLNASALLKTLNASFISASIVLDNLLSSDVNINSSSSKINGNLSLVNSSLTTLFLSKNLITDVSLGMQNISSPFSNLSTTLRV